LKPIYTAVSAEAAEAELNAFAEGPWGKKFPRACQLFWFCDMLCPKHGIYDRPYQSRIRL
jgi:transposase-like protein